MRTQIAGPVTHQSPTPTTTAAAAAAAADEVLAGVRQLLLDSIQAPHESVRMVALQWALKLFPFSDVPARYVCILGAADTRCVIWVGVGVLGCEGAVSVVHHRRAEAACRCKTLVGWQGCPVCHPASCTSCAWAVQPPPGDA